MDTNHFYYSRLALLPSIPGLIKQLIVSCVFSCHWIAEGDVSGSFILKDRSHSATDHNTAMIKVAKYSIALQYLVFEGIVEEQV